MMRKYHDSKNCFVVTITYCWEFLKSFFSHENVFKGKLQYSGRNEAAV